MVLVLPTISGRDVLYVREIVLERIRAVNEYIRSDVDGFQEEWLQCPGLTRSAASGMTKEAGTGKETPCRSGCHHRPAVRGLCSWKSQSGQIQKDVCGLYGSGAGTVQSSRWKLSKNGWNWPEEIDDSLDAFIRP